MRIAGLKIRLKQDKFKKEYKVVKNKYYNDYSFFEIVKNKKTQDMAIFIPEKSYTYKNINASSFEKYVEKGIIQIIKHNCKICLEK